jgi:uncharacterized protein involved in outer membrane biogenesis
VRAWVIVRRVLIALAGCAVVFMGAALGLAACIDAGLFRSAVIRFVSLRAARPISVEGALHVDLLARHPDLKGERVTIDNPPWVPAGHLAQAGEISLVMHVPWFDGAFGIVSLSMKSATLHLMRNAAGYANWQVGNPDLGPSTEKKPILRSLSIPDAQVVLDDQRRHLRFEGVVSADGGDGASSHLTIKGEGQLNGHADSFEISGDPLAAASHHIPYHFSFSERSSGSELVGQGLLPKPFDFDIVDASFDASGADLRDLYFLTGVSLINSGAYKLSGKILRRGDFTGFADLAAKTGQSDVRGSVDVQVSGGRPRLNVKLDSKFLRMADFGLRAAGRAPETGAPPLLLSDATFNPPTLRLGDADIRYRAERLLVGRVILADVVANGTLEQGVLTVTPLTADILAGKLRAHVRLDAKTDDPKTHADIDITGLQLGEIGRKEGSAPPATGLLHVRVDATGTGRSLHQIAASANGTVAAVTQQGTVRDSLAEMTGVDLRGLGLMATKSHKEIPLRCAVAQFEAKNGILTATRLLADTESVLIMGRGQIHLDTEALDLAISGHPKSLRLFRFQAPVLIKGTLSHPAIDVQAHKLTLIDPGNAKDADCASLERNLTPLN